MARGSARTAGVRSLPGALLRPAAAGCRFHTFSERRCRSRATRAGEGRRRRVEAGRNPIDSGASLIRALGASKLRNSNIRKRIDASLDTTRATVFIPRHPHQHHHEPEANDPERQPQQDPRQHGCLHGVRVNQHHRSEVELTLTLRVGDVRLNQPITHSTVGLDLRSVGLDLGSVANASCGPRP